MTTTRQPKPMQVTKANITRVLTQAGYKPFKRASDLFARYPPGFWVGSLPFADGQERMTFAYNAGSASYRKQTPIEQVEARGDAEYADALRPFFRVEQMDFQILNPMGGYRTVKRWAVFPLDAPAPPAHETQEAEDE